jgi:hypothetical protein
MKDYIQNITPPPSADGQASVGKTSAGKAPVVSVWFYILENTNYAVNK